VIDDNLELGESFPNAVTGELGLFGSVVDDVADGDGGGGLHDPPVTNEGSVVLNPEAAS
jgi:hypothetical protein